jgi:hypothetical protein
MTDQTRALNDQVISEFRDNDGVVANAMNGHFAIFICCCSTIEAGAVAAST